MKRLHIQVQLTKSPGLDADEISIRLRRVAEGVRVTEGLDDGRYLNFDIKTADLPELWRLVRAQVHLIPGLAQAAIVVCEGEFGWDDYLLLHHFDPDEDLDEMLDRR